MDAGKQSIRFFTAKDSVPGALAGERIAVLGYGNLGRPFALNLRDAGVSQIKIGNIADRYAEQARAEGFETLPVAATTAGADIVLILLPGEVIPEAFPTEIALHLAPGAAIVFASGYTLAYGLIQPPPAVDVLMLAPRMAGKNARRRFLASLAALYTSLSSVMPAVRHGAGCSVWQKQWVSCDPAPSNWTRARKPTLTCSSSRPWAR